jgi:hypothetical protein
MNFFKCWKLTLALICNSKLLQPPPPPLSFLWVKHVFFFSCLILAELQWNTLKLISVLPRSIQNYQRFNFNFHFSRLKVHSNVLENKIQWKLLLSLGNVTRNSFTISVQYSWQKSEKYFVSQKIQTKFSFEKWIKFHQFPWKLIKETIYFLLSYLDKIDFFLLENQIWENFNIESRFCSMVDLWWSINNVTSFSFHRALKEQTELARFHCFELFNHFRWLHQSESYAKKKFFEVKKGVMWKRKGILDFTTCDNSPSSVKEISSLAKNFFICFEREITFKSSLYEDLSLILKQTEHVCLCRMGNGGCSGWSTRFQMKWHELNFLKITMKL